MLLRFVLLRPSNCYLIVCFSMLWCYKFEGLVPLKRLIPLQMFAPVLSQESDVQWLSDVYMVHKCFSFLYRLDCWFSRLNGVILVIVRGLYSLLFGLTKTPCWRPYLDLYWCTFINCYLYGEMTYSYSYHILHYLWNRFASRFSLRCMVFN